MSAIFRQLTAGIKFDKRKYRQEAEKFGLVKKCENEEQNENFEKTVSLTLEDDFVPDSNLPTPDDSGEENNELQLLGKDYQSTCMFWPHELKSQILFSSIIDFYLTFLIHTIFLYQVHSSSALVATIILF